MNFKLNWLPAIGAYLAASIAWIIFRQFGFLSPKRFVDFRLFIASFSCMFILREGSIKTFADLIFGVS